MTKNKIVALIIGLITIIGVGFFIQPNLPLGDVVFDEIDMKWNGSYSTYLFDSIDGDLSLDEYAIDGDIYVYRIKSKESGQFLSTTSPSVIFGKNKVNIIGEACYNEFIGTKGIVRERTPCSEHQKHFNVKNNPNPKKIEKVSKFKIKEALAAIAYVSTSNSGQKTSVSSYTFTHTTASGDSLLVFGGSYEDNIVQTHDTVTFNSDSMTEQVEQTYNSSFSGADTGVAVYYMLAPDVGSNLTVAVTLSGTATDASGGVVSYSGTATSNVIDGSDGQREANQNTDELEIPVTTSNAWVFSVHGGGCNVSSLDSGQNSRWDIVGGAEGVASDSGPVSAQETHGYNGSCSSTSFVYAGISFKVASGATRKAILITN